MHRLLESRQALTPETIRAQLQRSSCQLPLPPAGSVKLTDAEIRQRAHKAHVLLGWVYRCTKCDEWHQDLAGGYFLTTNGAVATAYHVVQPPRDLRVGVLVVENHEGTIYPVTEVLAANRHADACIVQVKGSGFTPLPLSTNIAPGDRVYCLSDPQGQRGVFTQGNVNRLLSLPERRLENVRSAPLFAPSRVEVSASWGPGSSGSAVLDESGNAIGHASSITLADDRSLDPLSPQEPAPRRSQSFEATSARDVLSLVQRSANATSAEKVQN